MMGIAGCEFCQLVAQDGYPLELAVSDWWMTCLSFQQHYPGRGIIVAKRHVRAISELTADELVEFQRCLGLLEEAVTRTLGAEAFNVAALMNGAYGCEKPEPHLHFHVIPRYRGNVDVLGHVFSDALFGQHYNPYAPEFLDGSEREELAGIIRDDMASSHRGNPRTGARPQ